jgi:hypothetical protein
MTDSDSAMDVCLARICFNQPAVLIVRSHGVTNAEAFRTISYQSMAQFVETIVATWMDPTVWPAPLVQGNKATQTAAANSAATAPAQPIVMPYTALRGIKSLPTWLDYQYVRGESIDVNLLYNALQDCWILCIDVLDDNIRNP